MRIKAVALNRMFSRLQTDSVTELRQISEFARLLLFIRCYKIGLVVSSTASKMGATESKCALPMFIADHTTKLFYNADGLILVGEILFLTIKKQ